MSAKSGRSILRSLYEPALKGVATAGKVLVADSNTNVTGLTLTNPTLNGATATGGSSTASQSGIGSQVGGLASGSFSQATSTALTSVTGLSVTLAAGSYIVDGYLATTNNGTGGIKIALTPSGGAVVGSAVLDTWVYNTTTLTAEANQTSLASPLVNAAVAATAVFFGGGLIVTTGGTLTLQAAQNTSNATALTIANASYITFNRVA